MIESVHFHFDARLQAKLEALNAKYDALSKVHMEVVSRNVALLSENKKLRNKSERIDGQLTMAQTLAKELGLDVRRLTASNITLRQERDFYRDQYTSR